MLPGDCTRSGTCTVKEGEIDPAMESLDTISDLPGVINAAKQAKERLEADLWWRGHAAASWKLVPGVYRQGVDPLYERNINLMFVQRAGTRRDKCPEWEHWDSWLFLMRHYQLPTRLLDWTESPLIATYFAVSGHPSESATLWALGPSLLNKLQSDTKTLWHPKDRQIRPYFEEAFRDTGRSSFIQKVLAVAAQEVDIRMLVQLSTFTIHGVTTPLEDLEESDKFLIRFDIPTSAKVGIKDDLAQLGITESRLFPDLEHLASELASLTFPDPET